MKKIDKDDLTSVAKLANDVFGTEDIQITEEDLVDNFDKHLNAPKEFISNKDQLYDIGEHCNRYEPCPICNKCRVKASHLYAKCDNCDIPICVHDNKTRERFIKRDNFKQELPKAFKEQLKKLSDIYTKNQ